MQKLKSALVGCGRVSPNHKNAYLANSDALELVGICDLDYDKAKALFCDIQAEIYTDYKKMISEQKPQVVAVATDSGSHFEVAMYAILNGCHVIVEKPITLSVKEALELNETAKKQGVIIVMCHQNRFNKPIQLMRKALEEGRFGKLLHGTIQVRWHRDKNYYSQADWRGTWDKDGGTLMNQCIHGIDLLRWMMGDEIDEIFAFTDRLNHDYIEAEDLGLALIRFKNGAYGVVEGTVNCYERDMEETLCVFGEKGMAKVGGRSVNLLQDWCFADKNEDTDSLKTQVDESPENVYGNGHKAVYRDAVSAIINGTQPYIDGMAGLRALETVLAIYRSAATGKPVKLPLDSCDCSEFKGRFDNK